MRGSGCRLSSVHGLVQGHQLLLEQPELVEVHHGVVAVLLLIHHQVWRQLCAGPQSAQPAVLLSLSAVRQKVGGFLGGSATLAQPQPFEGHHLGVAALIHQARRRPNERMLVWLVQREGSPLVAHGRGVQRDTRH